MHDKLGGNFHTKANLFLMVARLSVICFVYRGKLRTEPIEFAQGSRVSSILN